MTDQIGPTCRTNKTFSVSIFVLENKLECLSGIFLLRVSLLFFTYWTGPYSQILKYNANTLSLRQRKKSWSLSKHGRRFEEQCVYICII